MEKKILKPFESRLIIEYCDLRERCTKLKESLDKGDEFKNKVGEETYDILSKQFSAMETYLNILNERIDKLDIRDNVPEEWFWNRGNRDDEMLTRDKIISKAYTDCMEELYQKSQPPASYIDYVNRYRIGELTDKDHVHDHHFLSQEEYEYIIDKYVYAYGMTQKWKDYVDTVVAYLDKDAIKDKQIEEYEDEYGHHPAHRGYEKLPDIKTVIETYLTTNAGKTNAEKADAIKTLILQRIDDCKHFYRFDREEGDFKTSIALGASPTSDPERVKKYWKEKGIDVDIVYKDPLTLWERDYYGDQYEEYINSIEDDEDFIDEE